MPYPQSNEGVGGLAADEHDLLQKATDVHAKSIVETSLEKGRTVTYIVPPSQLEGEGPYEATFESMDGDWTEGSSALMYGKFKVVKVDGTGAESACSGSDDYSIVNLPGNAMFKQMELYVGNTNVIDQGTSLYHYKSIIETILSMKNQSFLSVAL